MGKSTTAGMFAEAGIPVWDADAAVHRLYAPGGAAVAPVAARFPAALGADGGIDRAALKAEIARDPSALDDLNAIVHPLVAADRAAFIERAAREGAEMVVVDVPLLFETGAQSWVDAVVVASVPEEIQRQRVLARPGMTEAHLATILARQMPDAEKRARADYVVITDSMDHARAQVAEILRDLRARAATAPKREKPDA
ncbi:MAG: dephospho-CoA kinase [Alphaproteobacteria bacterium]|nr:MAG: dephospho-CoA kinase [Alphaproteobacteria bacterium]